MSIKKLMKIKSEWNLGGENIEFIKSEVHNESYFKSKEYASLVKVDLLKQVLERVDVKAQENLLKEYVFLGKKMDKMNNKIMKVFVMTLFMIFVVDIWVAVSWKKNPFMVGLFLQMILVFFVIWLSEVLNKKTLNSRMQLDDELKIISERHFSVKDENGDGVKAIWFLYHNLHFENEMEREVFLMKNYEKYNHYFAREFLDSGKNVLKDNYLDCLLTKKNEELKTERKVNVKLTIKEPEKVQVLL